jgi:hypothetical protein
MRAVILRAEIWGGLTEREIAAGKHDVLAAVGRGAGER